MEMVATDAAIEAVEMGLVTTRTRLVDEITFLEEKQRAIRRASELVEVHQATCRECHATVAETEATRAKEVAKAGGAVTRIEAELRESQLRLAEQQALLETAQKEMDDLKRSCAAAGPRMPSPPGMCTLDCLLAHLHMQCTARVRL